MTSVFTLTLFTPGEAEKITGLSTAMQRDWRHRGLLPKNDGHARFDAFGLASMLSMKLLSDRGVGPQLSAPIAFWCAAGAVSSALRWVNAYEGDHITPEPQDSNWGEIAENMKRKILRQNGVPFDVARYFIWWADGSHIFTFDLNEKINSFASFDPQIRGPIVVLDLDSLGTMLLDRADRPLVHVDSSGQENQVLPNPKLEFGPSIPLNPDRPS